MIGIVNKAEAKVFNYITQNSDAIAQKIQRIEKMGLTEKDLFMKTMIEAASSTDPAIQKAIANINTALESGTDLTEPMRAFQRLLPNDAAMIELEDGIAVMAKGWEKPIIFPNKGAFKMLGFADDPNQLTTGGLWRAGYGEQPGVILGGIGNSNIKPEQVLGGCSLSKKELSQKYVDSIVAFWDPIVRYFQELGVKMKDIGTAFAHSHCGVDEGMRIVTDKYGLRGMATTPTAYTQYLKPLTEVAESAQFPKGAVVGDFPYPTVLTRGTSQIRDYATVYSRLVGEDNPIGVFGGGQHAFVHDSREAIVGLEGSKVIPVDIMRDVHGIIIPATRGEGKDKVVTNTARKIIEDIDGNPYEQYRYAFRNYLPSNALKEDIAQYDPQMAMATHIHAKLTQAGKIPH